MNNKMNYRQFKIELTNEIKKHFSQCEILEQKTFKNNIELDTLTVKEKTKDIAPNIYVNYIYDDYIDNDYTFNDIILKTMHCVENAQNNAPDIKTSIIYDSLNDINTLKANVCPRLVKQEGNEELLQHLVHRKFLDLAIYYVVQEEDASQLGLTSVRITNDIINGFNIKGIELTEDLLYTWSINNLERTDNQVISMINTMQCMMFDFDMNDYVDEYSEEDDMLVLSNNNRINGANNILNNSKLKEVATKINSDLIILPSSIHEILLLPTNNNTEMGIDDLKGMVMSVNSDKVEPEEQLSDTVYIYRKDLDKVLIAE